MEQKNRTKNIAAALAVFLGAAFFAAALALPKAPAAAISAEETPVLRPLTD
ncbi:MAG: hypothetical protein M0025_04415 [Elusimicrobia bacterium]|nr:hypothetical protein [Elusimicrobiota bacterium]